MKTEEIECLVRLDSITQVFHDLYAYLVEEKLATKEDVKAIQTSSHRGKAMQAFLDDLKKRELIQLLEYEWMILPVERIKILIVTSRSSREFVHNY
jgi:hypothetical protein